MLFLYFERTHALEAPGELHTFEVFMDERGDGQLQVRRSEVGREDSRSAGMESCAPCMPGSG